MSLFYKSLLLLFLIFSCQSGNHKKLAPDKQLIVNKKDTDNYPAVKQKAVNWINHFNLDLPYIQRKQLGAKKFLAEYIGFFLKLYKNEKDTLIKKQIKDKLKPYYDFTQKNAYHNMQEVNDKVFKKNSMSYLRVMWLLNEFGFDISTYKKHVLKIKPRLDTHFVRRGKWQKEVFKAYYTFFNFDLPEVLQNTAFDNGVIGEKLPFEKYNLAKAYNFTHFIFAAFEYGNKTTQQRFTASETDYIKKTLPKFTKYYRDTKPNIDLLGEFVTCMVYMGFTDTQEFKDSYKYLLNHQNPDGSWGSYEKLRNKLGKDVEFRAYLHTSLVVFEALYEYNEGQFAGSKKG